jgi:hypothetical protein
MSDKTDQIGIPKPPQERLRLSPDYPLEMIEEQGVAVFSLGQPLTASATNDMLRRIREERDWANLGKRAQDE